MSGRAQYTYNSDPKLKDLIDTITPALVTQVETSYNMEKGMKDVLTDFLKFYLIHGMAIVAKTVSSTAASYTILHPELDDVTVQMEPTPTLTLTRILPLTQTEDRLVIGEPLFRMYAGSLSDIDFKRLLVFLGYTEIAPPPP